MNKFYRYLITGLGLMALSTSFIVSANAADTNNADATSTSNDQTPSLSMPELEVGQKTLVGKTTKGTTITVRANDAKKTKIASTTASKTTGKYTIKLPKTYSVYTKLYVYAQNKGSYNYFYRIVTIQPKGTYTKNDATTSSKSSSKTDTKKSTSKTSTAKNNNSTTSNSTVTIQDPNGTWQSNAIKGAYTKYIFSQDLGLTELNYNGKKAKTVIKNASYQVVPHKNNFWEIKYRQHGESKYTSFYIHFNTNSQFYLTNAKNQVVSSSSDNTFNLIK